MNAYDLGVVMGALAMVAVLAYVATRLLRGAVGSRIVGAVVGLAVMAGVASWMGCSDKRKAAAVEQSFVQACERTCRVENAESAGECSAYCRCSAQHVRKGRSDAEFVEWAEEIASSGNGQQKMQEMRAEIVPVCGREIVRKQFVASCEKGCAGSGAVCPPGVCSCMANLVVTDARFTDPSWVAAVVLAEQETPEATAWGDEAFKKCAPQDAPAGAPAADEQ